MNLSARREFLRGALGTAVCLPLLEFHARDAYAEMASPKRFVAVYHPNGVFTPAWFPTIGTSESDFALGPIHKTLEPWKRWLLFTSGIDMKVAVNGVGEMHQRGIGGWLTGQKLASGDFVGNDGTKAGYALGASIDQTLVGLIGKGTPLRSLQLGVHALEGDVSGVVSYAGPNQPLLPQNDPRTAFRSLFGMQQTSANLSSSFDKSVLDSVVQQIQNLQKRLGSRDKQVLDRHLTLVRELELRVLKTSTSGTNQCVALPPPTELNYGAEAQLGQVAELQVDLILAAFSCDLLRTATLMVGDAKDHIAIPHLGIKSDVHNLTHLSDGDVARAQVGDRDAWVASLVARLIKGLDELKDANGESGLKDSLVFWGSDVSQGNIHSHDNMPFVLAGGGTGFTTGRFATWQKALHNDLLVAIINGFGGSLSTYGDPAFCSGRPLGHLVS